MPLGAELEPQLSDSAAECDLTRHDGIATVEVDSTQNICSKQVVAETQNEAQFNTKTFLLNDDVYKPCIFMGVGCDVRRVLATSSSVATRLNFATNASLPPFSCVVNPKYHQVT